jgi:hypothetical protein
MSLKSEIKKFRAWAKKYPVYKRTGEWECDYPKWVTIYAAFDDWLNSKDNSLDAEEIDDILYLIARDNECENIIKKIAKHQELTLQLANLSVNTLHSDAKWQLAKAIGAFNSDGIDQLLFNISLDRSNYVQRICMMESAKRKSNYTKGMIEWSWSTSEEYQQISAIWSLYWIGDTELTQYLKKAKESNVKYLVENAQEIENKLGIQ